MRKNKVLLGATMVVCLTSGAALADQQKEKKPIRLASLEEARAVRVVAPTKAVKARKKKARRRTAERLVAKINLSSQRMTVLVDGKVRHSWKISSGALGHHTPTGSYKPYSLQRMHYSRKYNNAAMPHSVFFRGGFAIHATGAVWRLGTPASHGCVRLSPAHARQFYALVQKYSKAGTRIRIFGRTPASHRLRSYASRRGRRVRRSTGWSTFGSYGNNRVSYRRNSVRRIRIGQNRRRHHSIFVW